MKLLVPVAAMGASIMSASALAATLFTAPLPGGGSGVYCQVLNVSTSPQNVTITIFDSHATPVNSQTCSGLASLNSCPLAVPGAGVAPHACRIDVDGSKTSIVRGSIVRLTSDGVPAVALPAE